MKDYCLMSKRVLCKNVAEYKIYAPNVARHCLAGQFVILRVDEDGERVPFTICDYSRQEKSVSILVQEVGYTTARLAMLEVGDCLQDFVGPLGMPTDLSGYKHILLVGGGIGSAVIYPQAKQLAKNNVFADVVLAARNKDLLIYEDDFAKWSNALYTITDDGSCGRAGYAVDIVSELLSQNDYDLVFAVGPLVMMRSICDATRVKNIKTIVSMNSLMVDGTGMCGCCRVSVGGQTKYACVDGPEFDGHLVDFDEAVARSKMYKAQEHEMACRLKAQG